MQQPSFRQKWVSVWLDGCPESACYECAAVLRHSHEAKPSTVAIRQNVAIRYIRVTNHGEYGLLGATFTPQNTGQLVIEVNTSRPVEGSFAGLEMKYAEEVFSVAVIAAFTQSDEILKIGCGTLTFNCAQTHPVDTSPLVMMLLTLYVLRLLVFPEAQSEQALFDYLAATKLYTEMDRNDTAFIPGLLAANNYDKLCVRKEAISLMGRVASPLFEPYLLDALGVDETQEVAAIALGAAGFKSAIPHLIPLFRRDSSQWRVAYALKKLDWQPTNEADAIAMAVATKDWNNVIRFGQKAIPGLLEIVQNSEGFAAVEALGALEKIGDYSVVPQLIEALRSNATEPSHWNKYITDRIVRILKQANTPEAREALSHWAKE